MELLRYVQALLRCLLESEVLRLILSGFEISLKQSHRLGPGVDAAVAAAEGWPFQAPVMVLQVSARLSERRPQGAASQELLALALASHLSSLVLRV